MLSSGMQCYHLELMLSSEANVIILSLCYHLGRNVIIWDEMISSGANVLMLQNGAYVSIIWVEMISSGANV
jgi:hypothetical protein